MEIKQDEQVYIEKSEELIACNWISVQCSAVSAGVPQAQGW